MTPRSYNQYCPIAHALDLIGDRWTLLIVRDLLLGPKRFTDLVGGLPGVATNLLTDRLKGLEQAGVVQRRTLPPPAASTIYELTAYGLALEGPLVLLAQWGGQTLGHAQPDQFISRDSVLLTARALIRALAPDTPALYQIDIVDGRLNERIALRASAGQVEIVGEANVQPDVVLQLDVDTLFALAGGGVSFEEGIANGALRVLGDADTVARLAQRSQSQGASGEATSSASG